MNFEPELDADEQDALRAWATCDVPGDFAERVAAQAAAGAQRSQRIAEAEARPMWAAWWIGIVAAAAAVVLALSLLASPPAHEGVADGRDEITALREAARDLLARECTPCHLAEAEGAEADAIAVFDVADPQWDAGLSSTQLAIAVDRVAESGAGQGGVAGFRRYVDAELARRGAGVR